MESMEFMDSMYVTDFMESVDSTDFMDSLDFIDAKDSNILAERCQHFLCFWKRGSGVLLQCPLDRCATVGAFRILLLKKTIKNNKVTRVPLFQVDLSLPVYWWIYP